MDTNQTIFIDLTIPILEDNPLIMWAKSQDNPHIAMGHIGTHLDTYEKTKIPLEYFKSNGILFHVKNKAEIDLTDIDISLIPKNAFVLFRTEQIEKYTYGDKEYFNEHPQLSPCLIDALLVQQIRFIGIDCAGIRKHSEHEKADRLCEQKNTYVIENLYNLNKLTSNVFDIYTMWIDDPKMTGLKCRVIAEIPSK